MSLVKIQIDNNDLILDADYSYLNNNFASAQNSITVDSITSFAINQILLIGDLGAEDAEIILTHGSTAPSGNTVTLLTSTTKAHGRGTKVSIIKWNQYELSHATTSTGSKTTLNTTIGSGIISIDPEKSSTLYYDAEYSSGGYFTRKKNSISSVFSDFSDYISYTGYSYNQIGYIKNTAIAQLGEKKDELLNDDFLNQALFEGRRELDNAIPRWSFRTSFNTDIGDVVEGAYSVSVPTTLRDPDRPDHVLGLRIGGEGQNIGYVTKREFDRWYISTPHTTVATQPSVGATSIVLTSSRDFAESGSIRIASNTITYTSNTQSTGTLTGIPASGTGSITIAHATTTDVWQNQSFGLPSEYTIFEDKIYFNVPFESTYVDRNIEMDFYRTIPEYDTDGDTLDESDPDMFISYLKWKIKYLRSSGKLNLTKDSDYLEWLNRKKIFITSERANQYVAFSPDISSDME